MAKKRKAKLTKYQISATRRGVMQYEDAWDAPAAARAATRLAKQGWSVRVQPFHTKRLVTHMTCEPTTKKGKTFAACKITNPSFRKAIQLR